MSKLGKAGELILEIINGARKVIGKEIRAAKYAEELERIRLNNLVKSKAVLSIKDRLKIFFRRLELAEPADNSEDALKLICNALDEVEDAHSGVEKIANPGKTFTGRMYPPFEDSIVRSSDGSILAKTKGHNINIKQNGSFSIIEKATGKIEIVKTGKLL